VLENSRFAEENEIWILLRPIWILLRPALILLRLGFDFVAAGLEIVGGVKRKACVSRETTCL
jgi:hypothetical protein